LDRENQLRKEEILVNKLLAIASNLMKGKRKSLLPFTWSLWNWKDLISPSNNYREVKRSPGRGGSPVTWKIQALSSRQAGFTHVAKESRYDP